jgi:DNA-binding NarL/FixJ family response regulator
MGNRRHVLIVDPLPIVRRGLTLLLAQEADLASGGEASDVRQALDIISTGPPDLIVIELAWPDQSGLDLVKTLRQHAPDTPMLILSVCDETLYAIRALNAGVQGYIMKHEPVEKVLQAMRQVLRGEYYLSERMTDAFLHALRGFSIAPTQHTRLAQLSSRELDVLRFLGQGRTTREIACILSLSVKTVETHRTNIIKKLALKSSTDLIRYAVQWLRDEGAISGSAVDSVREKRHSNISYSLP